MTESPKIPVQLMTLVTSCQRMILTPAEEEEDSATHEEDTVEAVPVNLQSRTVRTRTGRQITLSYRALSSYWGTKSYFFLQKLLKTRVNSKYQSKGSTYILYLLAFVEIRLFKVFFWERKAGFGKLMKNLRDAGFSRKRGRNAGSGPPLPDPVYVVGISNQRISR